MFMNARVGCRVGDGVHSAVHGFGRVYEIVGGTAFIRWDDRPKLKEEPKKEVVVDIHLNIYETTGGISKYSIWGHESKAEADRSVSSGRLGEAVHIKHTYTEAD